MMQLSAKPETLRQNIIRVC